MDSKELTIVDSKELSVNLTDSAIQQMNKQAQQLELFVKSQMKPETDFGIIPGTKKPSLYKPGAEKLRKIFQLGSRIVDKTETIDFDKNFAMFSYTVEVFHIPTGKAISQCQGSANSHEKKYKERKKYVNGEPAGVEPVPIAEVLNTLQKMAQKRADVGATISATNASSIFTQDVEDLVDSGLLSQERSVKQNVSVDPSSIDFDSFKLNYGRNKGILLSESDPLDLQNFVNWVKDNKVTAQGPVHQAKVIEEYLKFKKLESEVEPPKFDEDEPLPF